MHKHTRTQVTRMKLEFRLSRLDTLNRARKSLQPGTVPTYRPTITNININNNIATIIVNTTIIIINNNIATITTTTTITTFTKQHHHRNHTITTTSSSQHSWVEGMDKKIGEQKIVIAIISIIVVFCLGTDMPFNTSLNPGERGGICFATIL